METEFARAVVILRFIRLLLLAGMVFASIGAANAKVVVEQIYSNANGSIQFIVFRVEGERECTPFSVSSVHDGVVFPGYGYIPPPGLWTSDHILVATTGFQALGTVTPDYGVSDGFLGTGGGTIRFCGSELHYPAFPTNGITALDGSGSPVPNMARNAQGASGSVTAAQAALAALTINRLGLTGTWYQAATSGQGFALEVAPAPADLYVRYGHVMMAWATYDHSAIGGPERQRWYTLFTQFTNYDDAYSLPLDIYQNTGGNFNAGPITSGAKVGTATLSFTTCDQGKLDYTFNDDTGRSGSIAITRLMQNVTCYTTGKLAPGGADSSFSGNWYDPTTTGQGIFVEINPVSGAAFLNWYTYAPNGAGAGAAGQRWYTAISPYTAGARTLAMKLYATTGGLFDAAAPVPATVEVGTATLTFKSCTAATLDYNFTGGSSRGAAGRIALSKIGPAAPGCVM